MTGSPHVSALTLDAFALGALDGVTEAQVRAHLATCPRCLADHALARELRERFMATLAPHGAPRRPSRRWMWLAVPALAAVLLVALWRRPVPPPDLAVKGGASWSVYANRDGQTFAVHPGTALAPGDRIRFVVVPDGARYLLVASVDGAGGVTVYYPYDGAASAEITGERVELADSIVLDAAPGPERMYAILSDEPIAADIVKERLRAIAAGGAQAIRDTVELEVQARMQLSLWIEKAVP